MFVPLLCNKNSKSRHHSLQVRDALLEFRKKNAKQAIIFVLTHSQSIYGTSVETCRPYPRDYMSVANYLFYRRIITYFYALKSIYQKHVQIFKNHYLCSSFANSFIPNYNFVKMIGPSFVIAIVCSY